MAGKFRYEVIIYWSDEDQAFIAGVPELSGRAAQACRCRGFCPSSTIVADCHPQAAQRFRLTTKESSSQSRLQSIACRRDCF